MVGGVCTPLLEHGGDNVDLLAIEDGAQAFAVEPGAGGAFGGSVGDQSIEVGARFGGQPLAVLEQCPAQAFLRLGSRRCSNRLF